MDVIDAYEHFMAAAQTLGIVSGARADLLAMTMEHRGAASDILIRHCSADPQALVPQRKATVTEQRTWTRRRTRH